MHKLAFLKPVIATWAFLFLSFFLLTGCATTPAPDVRIEHIAVAPQDNLLVDCDVAAPPARTDYLLDFKKPLPFVAGTPAMPSHSELPYDNISYVTQYVQTLVKKAEAREKMQTDLNLKNYQNLDACNKRWKGLREWKANTLKELSNKKKE